MAIVPFLKPPLVEGVTLVSWAAAGVVWFALHERNTEAVVRDWLLCDECSDAELIKVLSHEGKAIGPLSAALRDGPDSTQIGNIKSQSRDDAMAMIRVRNRKQDDDRPVLDTVAMFGRDSSGYVDTYRQRAVIGLSTLAIQAARDSISALWRRDSTQGLGWSPRVKATVRAHYLGVSDLRILPMAPLRRGQNRPVQLFIKGHNQRPSLEWVSSDTTVVRVAGGVLTAIDVGQAIVRVCWSEAIVPRICAIRAVRVVA